MYFSLCRKGTKMKTENSTTSKHFTHTSAHFFSFNPSLFFLPTIIHFEAKLKKSIFNFLFFCPFYLFCYIFALFNKTCAIIIISFQCEWNFHAFFFQLFHFHCFSFNECLVSIFIMDFQIFSIILMVHSVYRELTIKLPPFYASKAIEFCRFIECCWSTRHKTQYLFWISVPWLNIHITKDIFLSLNITKNYKLWLH